MAAPSSALLDQLATHLGPRGFTRDRDLIRPWLTDWRGTTHGEAAALLSPASREDVQYIVTQAAAHGAQLTMQGGNSGMVAGATPGPDGDGLILSLRRMTAIRAINVEAGLLVAEAGVILANAHDAAAAAGWRFPLTLGGKGSATIGGLVSTNAGGTQVLRHGTMRGLTLGLEVVLADGSILNALAPLAKDNRGPDPKQLFIGGEGAFGVITAATLKLVPAIVGRAVAWVTVDSPATALVLLRTLDGAIGAALEAFEILPELALAHVMAHNPAARRPVADTAPWHVLIEVVDSTDPDRAASRLTSALATALDRGLIGDAVIAATEAQAQAYWQLRDSISLAERAQGPAIQHDVSVPVADMPGFITAVDARIMATFPGATTLSFGHLGDGNVHCHVRPPGESDGAAWIAAYGSAASDIVYHCAMALGGSISAEHGIGRAKRALLGRVGDPARISILRAMKAALDPHAIFNPGVLIP